jgi:hypothetical protein
MTPVPKVSEMSDEAACQAKPASRTYAKASCGASLMLDKQKAAPRSRAEAFLPGASLNSSRRLKVYALAHKAARVAAHRLAE